MSANIEIDLREWEAAIHKLKGLLPKSYEQIVGRSAGSICVKAFLATNKAKREKIKAKFQQPVATIFKRRKRKGKGGDAGTIITKSIKEIWEPTQAAWAASMRHFPGLRRTDPIAFQRQAYKLASQKFMSVNFIRSGWIFAIAALSKYMKMGGIFSIIKMARKKLRNKGKHEQGTGTITSGSMNGAVCEVFNNAVIKHTSAVPMAERALKDAVAKETAQLNAQAEKILHDAIFKSKLSLSDVLR